MRHRLALSLFALVSLSLTAPIVARAADDPITVELNAAEPVQSKCRVAFVIGNKSPAAVDSLKLDLAIFNRDGVVQRRIVTEMGPLRRSKTIVKTFEFENDCNQIGSVLINDVTACAPGDAAACLDRVTPTSKINDIKFYK
jgi:hypothetical protein